MKQNIETTGRVLRGILSLILLTTAGVAYFLEWTVWLTILLAISGVFVAFEALKGWCVARACGIKTRY